MSGHYLDGGGPSERELFLPLVHRQSGFHGSLDAFRAHASALDRHPYAARAVRDLVLCDEDRRAIASLRLTAIPSLHMDREIWVGGISQLVAHEGPGRDEALATIVDMTIALLSDEDVDGVITFADSYPPFLRDLGFDVVGDEGIEVPLTPPARLSSAATVRAMTAHDAHEVQTIHGRSGAGEPLWLRRDAERWDYLLRAAAIDHPDADPRSLVRLVLLRDHVVAGFAIAAARGQDLLLLDLGLEDPDEGSLATLLDSLTAAGLGRGCSTLRGPVPPGDVGRILRAILPVAPLREGLFLFTPLGDRVDGDVVIEGCRGYAALDRT